MRSDFGHLLRSLRRSPASAAAAILTLALTLGAGAAIFAVVNAVLLTPPPFANPRTLVVVGETPVDEPAAAPRTIRYDTFERWRERAGEQARLEAFDGTNLTLTGLGAAERVSANDVTPGFLALLGVTPALGRGFNGDDVGTPVVMIGHAFWRARLAADPGVIGRTLMLGGRAHAVIGVLPERFEFAFSPGDLWRPLPLSPEQAMRSGYRVRVVARLARASADDLAFMLEDVSRTSSPPARVVATPLATAMTAGAARTLGLLAGAAGLALLIAFTNLAGLLIVRAVDRRRELAVRTALGARRWEIARQLLLEAEALVIVGACGGVLLALWMTPAVGRLALEQFGAIANRDVAVSWRVIAAVTCLASLCAAICGLAPAVAASRRSAIDVLGRGITAMPRELTLRRAFVVAEVALAFVLLVSMALLGRSLQHLLTASPGFDARGVLKMQLALPSAAYASPERVIAFYSSLQSAMEQRLGPRAISFVDELPLAGSQGSSLVRATPTDPGREAIVRAAGVGYFDVMRVPIVAGRPLEGGDTTAAPLRAVVSQSLADRLFGGEQAVGRSISLGAAGRVAEIVGVAGDVKSRALDEALTPMLYLSALQVPSTASVLVVRSTRSDGDVIDTVREEVARLDGDLPVYAIQSMSGVVSSSAGMPARRVLAVTFTGFALLAVVLGALGLFGVVAHDVARRRTELALRLALGADPARILSATLGQGAWMVGAGLVLGGALSVWATQALGGVVVATSGFDIVSVAAAAGVLSLAGLVAVLPAARRAARTDPLVVLRGE